MRVCRRHASKRASQRARSLQVDSSSPSAGRPGNMRDRRRSIIIAIRKSNYPPIHWRHRPTTAATAARVSRRRHCDISISRPPQLMRHTRTGRRHRPPSITRRHTRPAVGALWGPANSTARDHSHLFGAPRQAGGGQVQCAGGRRLHVFIGQQHGQDGREPVPAAAARSGRSNRMQAGAARAPYQGDESGHSS